jgi:hypothetical protein
LRQAFHQMQRDLDPLLKGFSMQEETVAEGAAAGAKVETKSEALAALAPKIHKEERQQMEIADRVILEVLRKVWWPS